MRNNFCFALALLTLAFASSAKASDCASDELITQTIKSKEIKQVFRFSKNCLLSDKNEKNMLLVGDRYLNLEMYLPGFISKTNLPSTNQQQYTRAFLTLSYGPTPLMISSSIDRFYTQKSYLLIKEDNVYSYFKKLSPSYSSTNSSDKNIFISPKNRNNFWVLCMQKRCFVRGIEGKVGYEVNITSDDQQDWIGIHESTVSLINKIYTGTEE